MNSEVTFRLLSIFLAGFMALACEDQPVAKQAAIPATEQVDEIQSVMEVESINSSGFQPFKAGETTLSREPIASSN